MNNFFAFVVEKTTIKHVFIAIILFALALTAQSQSCLPEGIIFESQSQIDSFQINYPGCQQIEGDVYIGDNFGNYDITNLNGLNVLTLVEGDLRFRECHSLNDLTGLENLVMIYGNFKIDENNTLDSLTGLDNLVYIHGDLEILDNITLDKLTGLQSLDSVGGNVRIQDNNHIKYLTGLDNLKSIWGDLSLYTNINLIDLTGLDNLEAIGGTLGIWGNEDLESLEALQNLTYVGYDLEIVNNDKLQSLSGLDNIKGISGELKVFSNELLTNCEIQSICNYLSDPKGTVTIYRNAQGCNSPPEIAESCGVQLPCLPYGDYNLYFQDDIDNFSSNYPGCFELEGDVSINGDDITNLAGLNDILSVHGELYVSADNLTSLEGLENLQSVNGKLRLSHMDRLKTTKGLNSLMAVEELLDLYWNDSLVNLEGFESLTTAGALFITHNETLTDLTGFSSLDSVGILYIQSNDTLSSITGLSSLRYVGEHLQVMGNPYLSSLNGLENVMVDSLTLLYIGGNSMLSECDVKSVCDYLGIPEANVNISSNAPGCNTREEVEIACDSSMCLPFGIIFSSQAQVDSFPINYPFCTSIEGDVIIEGEDITNLDALFQVSQIGGDLILKNNDVLTSISGLGGLISLDGSLKIGSYQEVGAILILYNNPELNSLDGLEGLTDIYGELWIVGNLSISNLSGMDNISSIDSNLFIWFNSALADINSFYKLNSIGGTLSIWNNVMLPGLHGLDSIDPGSIERLKIADNHFLSECEVHSVCEYLKTYNSIVLISGNATGCFDETEVEDACENFSVDEQSVLNNITIYPNPAFNTLYIDTKGNTFDELIISNITGQKLLHLQDYRKSINISHLQAGIYIIEMVIESSRIRRKLLVQD